MYRYRLLRQRCPTLITWVLCFVRTTSKGKNEDKFRQIFIWTRHWFNWTVKLERHSLREQCYFVVNISRVVRSISGTTLELGLAYVFRQSQKNREQLDLCKVRYRLTFVWWTDGKGLTRSEATKEWYRDSCTCKCGTVLVCERNGCSDRDQRSTHARPTASCAVADRKNSTSVVVDIVDIVDSSHVTSVVVVVPFSCFLLVFGCRCFFLGLLAFLCFLLCRRFCFWRRMWQFLWRGGGRFNLPRCRRGGQWVCLGPSHRRVRVSAYGDRFPSGLLTGICVRLALPLLSSAKKVFFPLRNREYVL